MRSPICTAALAAVAILPLVACGAGETARLDEPTPIQAAQTLEQISALEGEVRVLEGKIVTSALSEEEEEELREKLETLRGLIELLQAQLERLEEMFAERTSSSPDPLPLSREDVIPLQTPSRDKQSPIVTLDGTVHVGANVAPPEHLWPLIDSTPVPVEGADVYWGALPAEVSPSELIAYLRHDYNQGGGHASQNLASFGESPPIVRIAYGTSEDLVDLVVRGVQIINAALPHYYQITISPSSLFSGEEPNLGEVGIQWAPRSAWGHLAPGSDAAGLARSLVLGDNTIAKSMIWIDPALRTTEQERLDAVVHEIMHTLGRQHPSAYLYPDTIMSEDGGGVPGHVLHPIDIKALQAVYDLPAFSVSSTTLYSSYGNWLERTGHLVADFGDGVVVGVENDSLMVRPWAYGPEPGTSLEANRALRGTVSWSGMLGGIIPYSPDADYGDGIIGGKADLSVQLGTLRGDLEFTHLRHLIDTSDGTRSGTPWRDGDLEYDVEIAGNTFIQTGGDAGIVTGAFFGEGHEGMGGTLRRDDLIAAFGGTR